MLLAVGLGAVFLLEALTRVVDLRSERSNKLRSRFELQTKLAALAAEVFELLIRVTGLFFQAACFAIESGNALFCLGHAIPDRRSCRNCLQDGGAPRFLLALDFHQGS